jgi:lysophospholipase L1-like esterase
MKTTLRSLALGLALLALAVAPPAARAVDTGSADFTRYVALGDSLTAGFCSGSIIETCQRVSYPALIFRQATGRSITEFQQPLVSAPGLPGVLRLVNLAPISVLPTPGTGNPINLTLGRPYDNLAVPGANLHDLLTKTASTTPTDPTDLVLRHISANGQPLTQLQQGLGLHPTFVTLWIGNNDALRAATNGVAIEGVTLTNPAQFDQEYRAVAGAITASGAKLAVATIPDVASIPFVTTLSRFIPNPQTGQPLIINGSPVPLIGVNAGDFVLLSAQQAMQQGFGIPAALGGNNQPLPDSVFLTQAEVATIRNYVSAYNNTIRSVATERGAALVDANAVFNQIVARGVNVGGVTFTAAYLLGGIFSYDGVHPTTFGYAYIANLFIDAINDKFGGEIPPVDLYPYLFGGNPLAPAATVDGAFYFSPLAWESLRATLGVPSPAELQNPGKPRKPRKPRGHH